MRSSPRWTVASLVLAVLLAVLLAFAASPARAEDAAVDARGAAPGSGTAVDDARLTSGTVLDLPRAVALALAHNPEVAALERDLDAAAAQLEYVAASARPSLNLVGGYAHDIDPQRLHPARFASDPALYTRDVATGDLVFSLPVYTGGRLRNQAASAAHLREAAGHRLARGREGLVHDVTALFYACLAEERVGASIASSRVALEEHLRVVRAMFEERTAARVDILRVEVRLADVRQREIAAANGLAVRRLALASLIGVEADPDSLVLLGDLTAGVDTALPDAADLLARAREGRSDRLAAAETVRALERSLDAARAGASPTLSLAAAYGGRYAAEPTSGLGDDLADAGRIGLVASLPLFDGGRTRANVLEATARLEAARERLRRLDLQVRLDVEASILDARSALERVEAVRSAVAQAEETLRIEREKYALGAGAIADVLDAQAALMEAETSLYRALADYHTARARMRLAAGDEV